MSWRPQEKGRLGRLWSHDRLVSDQAGLIRDRGGVWPRVQELRVKEEEGMEGLCTYSTPLRSLCLGGAQGLVLAPHKREGLELSGRARTGRAYD
jgi:hypothetical protein